MRLEAEILGIIAADIFDINLVHTMPKLLGGEDLRKEMDIMEIWDVGTCSNPPFHDIAY